MKDDAISRQAVLKLLSAMPPEETITKAMLIQSVQQMDAAQPEKRTEERTEKHACDCISRRAAIDATWFEPSYTDPLNVLTEVRDRLKELPSVQPKSYREGYQAGFKDAQSERKRGRWIYGEDNPGTGRDGWFCSECEHFEMWDYSADMKSAELNLPNYCPNCGADMREDDHETD